MMALCPVLPTWKGGGWSCRWCSTQGRDRNRVGGVEEVAENPLPSELVEGDDVCAGDRCHPTAWPKLDGVSLEEQRTPKAMQGGGCLEAFRSILIEVLSTEWLLQAQLETNLPSEFFSALDWKGNISSPCAAQSAAELIPNVHSSQQDACWSRHQAGGVHMGRPLWMYPLQESLCLLCLALLSGGTHW